MEIKDEKILEYSGERYLPWMQVGEIHYEHLHRYAFASRFVENKKVLDMGCGEGYGSNMLSSNAKYVLGVDIDEGTIKHASNKYVKKNLEFKICSVTNIPIENNEMFDVIICFETLEHLEAHEKLLSEVKRLLKKDGIFIISTPNKQLYSDNRSFQNIFHLRELYFSEFENLLRPYFSTVMFFGQSLFVTSDIWPLYKRSDMVDESIIRREDNEFCFTDIDKKEPTFFIAISSDHTLDNDFNKNNFLIDISNTLLNEKDKYIDEITREKDIYIDSLKAAINEKDVYIKNLESTFKEKDLEDKVYENELSIEKKDVYIKDLESTFKEKDIYIKSLESAVEEKDVYIRSLESIVEEKDVYIRSLESAVKEKDIEINNVTKELDKIKNSLVFRVVRKL